MPVIKLDTKSSPLRLHFPEAEAAHSWLPLLLDYYAAIDTGVSLAIANDKRPLACHAGCGNCCRTHLDIPIYPHELVGLYWFLAEILEEPNRLPVRRALNSHTPGQPCPFLLNESCAIHPMRPAACRQFNVFTTPCAPSEDPYHTRRTDVLTPLRDYPETAFYLAAPFYGLTDHTARRSAAENGTLHSQVRVLQHCNWKDIARKMEAIDATRRVI